MGWNSDKRLDNAGNKLFFFLDFLILVYEFTTYLIWSCENIPILIHLTEWNIVFFSWRKWHVVSMRLSTTTLHPFFLCVCLPLLLHCPSFRDKLSVLCLKRTCEVNHFRPSHAINKCKIRITSVHNSKIRKPGIRISARRAAILNEIFSCQSLQVNDGKMS